MSIIRIGLSETKNFSEGYEAIFSKKKPNRKAVVAKKTPAKAKKRTKKK